MLSIVINDIAVEFENVNNSERITFEYRYKIPNGTAPLIFRYEKFYHDLHGLLRTREKAATGVRTDASHPNLRYSSHSMESETSEESNATGASGESNAEHNTHALTSAFLWASLQTMMDHLEAWGWIFPKYEIDAKFDPLGRD